jgi:DNA-directed RNA polymerase subunit RPC12/RpoP
MRKAMFASDDWELMIGDSVTTTDSDTPLPVIGFRSGEGKRPHIRVGGAWYYPHEVDLVAQAPIEFRCALCGHKSMVQRRAEDPPAAIAAVYDGCSACGNEDRGTKTLPRHVYR